MARALFVCLHNAGRSQMSEALFHPRRRGQARSPVGPARPRGSGCIPEVVEVMAEIGIDLSGKIPTGR